MPLSTITKTALGAEYLSLFEAPEDLLCPVSHDLLVITCAGRVYEHTCLETHLKTRSTTDPLTSSQLAYKGLTSVDTPHAQASKHLEHVARTCAPQASAPLCTNCLRYPLENDQHEAQAGQRNMQLVSSLRASQGALAAEVIALQLQLRLQLATKEDTAEGVRKQLVAKDVVAEDLRQQLRTSRGAKRVLQDQSEMRYGGIFGLGLALLRSVVGHVVVHHVGRRRRGQRATAPLHLGPAAQGRVPHRDRAYSPW